MHLPGVHLLKRLEKSYITLLCNCPEQYITLVARSLPEELTSPSLPRLTVTLNSTLALLALNGKVSSIAVIVNVSTYRSALDSRVLSYFVEVATTLVHKLVDLIGWAASLLTPTMDAAQGHALIHVVTTSLAIITHIISNRVSPSSRSFVCALPSTDLCM